jgi:hypothetical protein
LQREISQREISQREISRWRLFVTIGREPDLGRRPDRVTQSGPPEPFDCQGAHHGVIGTQARRRNVQRDCAPLASDFQLLAKRLVCRHASRHTKRPQAGLFNRLQRFAHQAVNYGLLKACGQIRDCLWRQRRRIDRHPLARNLVPHRRL